VEPGARVPVSAGAYQDTLGQRIRRGVEVLLEVIDLEWHLRGDTLARLGEAADRDDDPFMCPVVFYELWRGPSYRRRIGRWKS
jgi:hypothetical protein